MSRKPTSLSHLERLLCTCSCAVEKGVRTYHSGVYVRKGCTYVSFSVGIGNVEVVHERFLKHSWMETARIK